MAETVADFYVKRNLSIICAFKKRRAEGLKVEKAMVLVANSLGVSANLVNQVIYNPSYPHSAEAWKQYKEQTCNQQATKKVAS